ncbi:DUF4349 domain-containing protein [Gehongia tenuis]|uniref:Anti-sigma-W factor RsiW n=1 Tax=Gehongia tenuis TaxID=2763655 RepID=A0A926D5G9_9FIRM|nr:DUF4349 domain-containing protein [Gehongia tenuis]MBC8531239.1 DUF4349 domain-containing protein [Gehongia tenuis]
MNTVNCEDYRRLCYLQDQLTPEERKALMEHLDTCPSCRKLYDEIEGMREAYGALEDEPNETVHELLHQVAAAKPKRRRRSAGRFVAIAAALVFLIVGTAVFDAAGLLHPEDEKYALSEGGYGYTGGAAQYADRNDSGTDSAAPMDRAPAAGGEKSGESENATTEEALSDEAPKRDMEKSDDSDSGAAIHGDKLIKNADLYLESSAFEEDVGKLEQKIGELGGYVEHTSTDGIALEKDPEYGGRSASYVLRVPKDSYERMIEEASKLGQLTSKTEDVVDATQDYRDVELRLEALRAQHEQVLKLLDQAETLEDVMTIQSELNDLQNEIDMLTGNLKYYDQMVEYSTITVNIREVSDSTTPAAIDPNLGERIQRVFVDSWNSLVKFAENMVLFLVIIVPYLAVVIPVGIIIWLIVRAVKKRREKV